MGLCMKNTEIIIEISAISTKGFGVGRHGDYVVLVNEGLPGDELLVKVVKAKKHYGYGKILRIIQPSPHRTDGIAVCGHSSRCGGCQWLHCNYDAQLGFKKQIVIDALTKIGGIKNPPVSDTIGMEMPLRYRNKGAFPVVPNNLDGFEIGMYEARSHRIIPIEDCAIQHPAHISVLAAFRQFMCKHKLLAYDETTHRGLVRNIMVRPSFSTSDVMVVVAINAKKMLCQDELVKELVAAGATTIVIRKHTKKREAPSDIGDYKVIFGPGHIIEHIGELKYMLTAPSFFQVNPIQTKVLYDIALTQAKLDGTGIVIDAHCGVGSVALYVAKHVQQVIGVDIVPSAIHDAKQNAALNGINNASFVCGYAEVEIPTMLANSIKPECIFLDPPRKGCDKTLLDAIIAAKIEKIVYISCDPATLARDIKILSADGYTLKVVQPVDMFPMTAKVEAVAQLVLG